MVAGMGLLTLLDVDTSRVESGLYTMVLGVGMGLLMQTSMLIAQNSVEQRDLGAASGAATFFRSIGGSVGVSLFGAIFASRLQSSAASRFISGDGTETGVDPAALRDLPAQVRQTVLTGLADSISGVFGWALLFAAAVPVLAWFIQEIPLRGSLTENPVDGAGPGGAGGAALVPEERDDPALTRLPVR
jgi:hypothetical protein